MRRILLICTFFILSVFTSAMVFADSERIVTLGADLSEQEQAKILRYFNAPKDDVRIIYVTNEEEHAHLGDYVPASVIGTRALSCAYVKPTQSGGIHVKTANLNWVTAEMIASALRTAGVYNCDVVAACPKEVSGTGALTGILKAYENTANTLSEEKKNTAAHEISVDSLVAGQVGQEQTSQIINNIKIQIAENEPSEEKVKEIVEEVVSEYDLDDETINELESYAIEVADDFEEYKETYDDGIDYDTETELEEDSILKETDETALGDVIYDATYEDDTIELVSFNNTGIILKASSPEGYLDITQNDLTEHIDIKAEPIFGDYYYIPVYNYYEEAPVDIEGVINDEEFSETVLYERQYEFIDDTTVMLYAQGTPILWRTSDETLGEPEETDDGVYVHLYDTGTLNITAEYEDGEEQSFWIHIDPTTESFAEEIEEEYEEEEYEE